VQNAENQAWSVVEQVEALLRGEMVPRAVNPEHSGRLARLWSEMGLKQS
jgi:hypothetical protein